MAKQVSILLVGDSECNKMDIVYYYNNMITPIDERNDTGVFNVEFCVSKKSEQYVFNITNIPASDNFNIINRVFYSKFDIAILFYSMKNQKTVETLVAKWYQIASNFTNYIIVVGMHADDIYNENIMCDVRKRGQYVVSQVDIEQMLRLIQPFGHVQVQANTLHNLDLLYSKILDCYAAKQQKTKGNYTLSTLDTNDARNSSV